MELWNICLLAGHLDTDIRARIIGVQNKMSLSYRIFSISDNLSKTIQSETMSAVSGLHFAELTIESAKAHR